MDRSFYVFRIDTRARDDEMKMDASEDFGILLCTLCVDIDYAAADRLACFAQYAHHVVCRAAARAGQHGFHRTRAKIASPALWCAVHDEGVIALGLRNEAYVFQPAYVDFQC